MSVQKGGCVEVSLATKRVHFPLSLPLARTSARWSWDLSRPPRQWLGWLDWAEVQHSARLARPAGVADAGAGGAQPVELAVVVRAA
jgi:hypothetical protein